MHKAVALLTIVGRWSASFLMAAALLAAPSGEVRKEGQMQVDLHCAVDLDDGECVCVVTLDGDGTEFPSHATGKSFDFRLESSGSRLYLQPRNAALLAKSANVESGLAGCVDAKYEKRRMRVDGLPKDVRICVRTNEGRYAELRIDDTIRPGSDRIRLRYKTWEK